MTSVSRPISEPRTTAPRISIAFWALSALVAGLFVWFYLDFFWRALLFGLNNKNWSHSLLVPAISAYFVVINRSRLSLAPIDAISARGRFLWWLLAAVVAGIGLASWAFGILVPLGLMGQLARLGGKVFTAAGGALLLAAAVLSPPMVRGFWQPVLDKVKLGTRPEYWLRALGLGVMVCALVAYVWSLYPISNHMAQGYSMILGLFGLVLFMLGPRAMAVLWLPIAYLVFAVKVSDRLWQQVAFQLQDIAATGSTIALKALAAVMSFEVQSAGNQITMWVPSGAAGTLTEYPINIAEACSGLRMLMAFVALGTALAFAWERKWWQRLVIVLATVPIAVVVNIGRVTVIGLLYLVDPELAQGDTHVFVGMLMLIPAALLLLGIGWAMDKIIIEEPTEEDGDLSHATGQAGPGDGSAGGLVAHLKARMPNRLSALVTPTLGGAGLGVGLMVLVGLVYVLVMGAYQPKVLDQALDPATAGALLWVAALALAAAVIVVPWLVLKPRGQPGYSRLMSVGVVASVLLVAGLGQQTVLGMTKAVLFKKPVPLRRPLVLLPKEVGNWEKVGPDQTLPEAQEDELGTDKYLIRRYRDKTWPSEKPGGMATVQVVYYPGSINTVPHVPDRCYVAGGMVPEGTRTVQLPITGDQYRKQKQGDGLLTSSQLLARSGEFQNPVRVPSATIPATLFSFKGRQTGRGGSGGNVIYFFNANGQYLHSPDSVRMEGWDLADEYAYYCKIEVAWHSLEDQSLARQRTAKLMSALLPEIMACLPDWTDVKAGQYPKDESGGSG